MQQQIEEKIKQIEKEIRETPYHKGTEHHIGKLRARLANLRDQIYLKNTHKSGGIGFAIKQSGDATVVLVGFPSVGKSTLLNRLTNAKSAVGAYEFTTVSVIPGMMNYNDAYIQILDVPGLIEGASQGKGKGKQVLSVARSSDLLLIITEAGKEKDLFKIEAELHKSGIRIGQERPKIQIDRKAKGGLILRKATKQKLDDSTIKEVAKEFGLINAEITLGEEFTLERLIDAFSPNRAWIPFIRVVNKIDDRNQAVYSNGIYHVSAKEGFGIEELKSAIWQKLDLLRVFTVKPQTTEPASPVIVRKGATLLSVAEKIGLDSKKIIKMAKISGPGSSFDNQKVSLDYRVEDGMRITFLN